MRQSDQEEGLAPQLAREEETSNRNLLDSELHGETIY